MYFNHFRVIIVLDFLLYIWNVLRFYIFLIHSFINIYWKIRIRHILRSQNTIADRMIKYEFNSSLNFDLIWRISLSIQEILLSNNALSKWIWLILMYCLMLLFFTKKFRYQIEKMGISPWKTKILNASQFNLLTGIHGTMSSYSSWLKANCYNFQGAGNLFSQLFPATQETKLILCTCWQRLLHLLHEILDYSTRF